MKKSEGSQQTVQAKWSMLTSSTELVFVLYNGMSRGGVENPRAELGEKHRGQASPESLEKLSSAGLIEVDNGRWDLSDTVADFLEALSGTSGEANVKTIIGNRETLERNVLHYLKAKEENTDTARYLNIIRRNLRKILGNIRKTLSAIEFSIRDTYVGEPNINIKTAILKENLEKLEELEAAVRGEPNKGHYDGIVPYIESAFGEGDEQLHALSVRFRTEFARIYAAKKSRISLQLREYLDRIEQIDRPARKIEQIFRLWCNNQLEIFSNVTEVLSNDREKLDRIRDMELSLDLDLDGDDNKSIEAIVRELGIEGGEVRQPRPGLRRSEIHRQAPATAAYSLMNEVKRVFLAYEKAPDNPLLAQFILSYPGFIKEHSFRERIGIFLETVNQFRPRLETDGLFTVFSEDDVAYKCKNIKLHSR